MAKIRYKKFYTMVILVLIIFIMILLIKNIYDDKKDGETLKIKFSTEAKKTIKNQDKIFKVGDTIYLNNFSVTVNNVFIKNGSKAEKACSGYEYMYINCTIKNTSKESQMISSSLLFKVIGENGTEYPEATPSDSTGSLNGTLKPNSYLTGDYVAEVPINTKDVYLILDNSFLTGGEGKVKLN